MAEQASPESKSKAPMSAAEAMRGLLEGRGVRESRSLLPRFATLMAWFRRQRARTIVSSEGVREHEPTPRGGHDDTLWHCPFTSDIIKANNLDSAYAILTHPVKKKVWDYTHRTALQRYEGRRIASNITTRARRDSALWRAKDWRDSLIERRLGDTK